MKVTLTIHPDKDFVADEPLEFTVQYRQSGFGAEIERRLALATLNDCLHIISVCGSEDFDYRFNQIATAVEALFPGRVDVVR